MVIFMIYEKIFKYLIYAWFLIELRDIDLNRNKFVDQKTNQVKKTFQIVGNYRNFVYINSLNIFLQILRLIYSE